MSRRFSDLDTTDEKNTEDDGFGYPAVDYRKLYTNLQTNHENLKRQYAELKGKYDRLLFQKMQVSEHQEIPSNVNYQGVVIAYDDSRGRYGVYHQDLKKVLFGNRGVLSYWNNKIDEEGDRRKFYELMLFVTVSSGGRKVNLMQEGKFDELRRRSKRCILIDCRPKKRFDTTSEVGDEDFSGEEVEIVYIMMPDGSFMSGDQEFNRLSLKRIVDAVEKVVPKMSNSWFGGLFG